MAFPVSDVFFTFPVRDRDALAVLIAITFDPQVTRLPDGQFRHAFVHFPVAFGISFRTARTKNDSVVGRWPVGLIHIQNAIAIDIDIAIDISIRRPTSENAL